MKQLFLAFTIGFILCFLGLKSCADKTPQADLKEIRQTIKSSEKQAEVISEDYLKSKQAFLKLSDSLKSENKNLSVKLFETKKLLKKQRLIIKTHLPCDSLRKEANILGSLCKKQDSLCNLSIRSLQTAIAIRDSQLVICDRSYQAVQDLQKENQLRELQLNEDLKTAIKSNRKKRFENKMLSFGWMIMAGLTTSLFIKSQH
jgi:hypothetical protein